LGRSVSKAKKALPKSSPLKVKVISALVGSLTPKSKNSVYRRGRKKLNLEKPGPKRNPDVYKAILDFLYQPDITYCTPNRDDAVYCGKDENGNSQYKSRRYLLYSILEIVALFNEENEEKVTYHKVREVINNEKEIIFQGDTPDDDCRCETCENAQLLLDAVKSKLRHSEKGNLAAELPDDPLDVVELGVCSVKNLECMKGECHTCKGSEVVDRLCEVLESYESITFTKWTTISKQVKKITEEATGEEIGVMFHDMAYGVKMRMHKYNAYRQYSELKYLKKNLKLEEVILSVDFSRNYENKQRHEIQSAYFGHEAFTIFTAISTATFKLKVIPRSTKKVGSR